MIIKEVIKCVAVQITQNVNFFIFTIDKPLKRNLDI